MNRRTFLKKAGLFGLGILTTSFWSLPDASADEASTDYVLDIDRARNDPVYFCENFVELEGKELELTDFQKRLLSGGSPIILKSRRGPSYVASVYQHQLLMRKLEEMEFKLR